MVVVSVPTSAESLLINPFHSCQMLVAIYYEAEAGNRVGYLQSDSVLWAWRWQLVSLVWLSERRPY